MKKSYIILAAAAMVFAACAEDGKVTEIIAEEEAISLESNVENTTRAMISSVNDLKASSGGFKVWGYKSKDDFATKTTIFNGVAVSWATDKWTYTPKKYWDKTCEYNFYAAAPASATFSIDNAGKISVASASYGKSDATSTVDYLIDRTGQLGIDGNATSHDPVGFDFHHIMAKVNFLVKTSLENATVKVKKITMTGWDSGNGAFTQTKTDGTWDVLNCSEWNIATAGAGSEVLLNGEEEVSTTALAHGTPTFLMIPQSISANTLTFTVDFTVDGESFTDQVGKIAAAQTWGTDSHTTYTIIVGPEEIKFTATSVCGFCVDGGNPEINVQ